MDNMVLINAILDISVVVLDHYALLLKNRKNVKYVISGIF